MSDGALTKITLSSKASTGASLSLPLSPLPPPLSLYLSLALTHHRILLLHRRNFLSVIRAEEAGHHDESFDRNDFRDEEREDRREDP